MKPHTQAQVPGSWPHAGWSFSNSAAVVLRHGLLPSVRRPRHRHPLAGPRLLCSFVHPVIHSTRIPIGQGAGCHGNQRATVRTVCGVGVCAERDPEEGAWNSCIKYRDRTNISGGGLAASLLVGTCHPRGPE